MPFSQNAALTGAVAQLKRRGVVVAMVGGQAARLNRLALVRPELGAARSYTRG
jgi:hypothetical protein